ncbi:MAG: hypothetical protein JWS12_340 [Candidatus Saccharibacteria bacterium]|nr:hypothetical protein [Candidatus Saccharibacteria bacterium]
MQKQPVRTSKRTVVVRVLASLGILILVFSLGVGVGQGHVSIGGDSIFRHNSVNKNLPANLDYSGVEEVYDNLKTNYDGQLTTSTVLDGLKKGLAQSTGDPYTEYFNAKDAKSFADDLNGTFTGIGAELSKDQNAIVIVSPITGFPAEKAGLKPKDYIVEIDGKTTQGMTVTEAVNKIRGPKDTKVTLTILRGTETLKLTITRDNITIPSVNTKILDGNIGYVQITRFATDTAELTHQAAAKFKSANVKGVVLDVRSDPGGLLDAAVSTASLWLPNGKVILQEKRGGQVVHTYNATGDPLLQAIPTALLIDEGSASASEILAGALKDNNVATLIGVKSFGKGSVQQIIDLSHGGALKVTIARWYTPGGRNIDKQGIEPQQKVVDKTADDIKNGRDPQLDAATTFLKK